MGEVLLLALLMYLAVAGILYAGVSYVYYRIASKFSPDTSFAVMLIPVYSTYLLYRTSIRRPGLYLLATFLLPAAAYIVGGETSSQVIAYFMTAHAFARIAERLGGNYPGYLIASLIPLVNVVVILGLAFGNSRPAPGQPERNGAPVPPPLPPRLDD